MADADKSLQDRLNALKPAGAISPGPSISYSPADTIERTKPPTKDDALSNRLKSLREQAESPKPPPSRNNNVDEATPTKQDVSIGQTPSPSQSASDPSPLKPKSATQAQQSHQVDFDQDIDPLLQTDDQTLEELLADLESDQPWLDEVAAEHEEHQRVMALLDEIGKAGEIKDVAPVETSGDEESSSSDGDEQDKVQGQKGNKNDKNESEEDDDNSDGEKMTDEVDKVLAKAMDEISLEKAGDDDHDPNAIVPQAEGGSTPVNPGGGQQNQQEQPDEESLFATRLAALREAAQHLPPTTTEEDDTLLPSVPTSEPQPKTQQATINSLGLPGAPTFAPGQRPTHTSLSSAKFTDEDQRSWCTVCLEDGAIRCLDCEDVKNSGGGGGEVYCARCWKEMHVGPMAGFEERGHRWEKFVRPRVK